MRCVGAPFSCAVLQNNGWLLIDDSAIFAVLISRGQIVKTTASYKIHLIACPVAK